VPSTGTTACPRCDDQAQECERCGGRALAPLLGAASVRGARWAEQVVRTLVGRWPSRWPRSPRAVGIARRRVLDLGKSEAHRARLARVCLEAAARRYAELTEYLMQRRLQLPDEEPPRRVMTAGS
jgi:hypothetical protein